MKIPCPNRLALTLPILIVLAAFIIFTLWLRGLASSFADPACSTQERAVVRSTLSIAPEWTTTIEGCFQTAPLLQRNRVIGRTNSKLFIFDAVDGKEMFSLDVGAIGRSPNFAQYVDLLVFSSNAGKKVNTLNIDTLAVLWSISPGQIAETGAMSTAMDDYAVYVASGVPGRFYAYVPNTGELLWNNPNVGGTFGDILTVKDDFVYVLVTNTLYKLEKKTGRLAGTIRNKFTGGETIVSDDLVYQFHSDKLTAQWIESGEVKWEFAKPGFSLAVLPERVIVASQRNRQRGLLPALYSLHKDNGQVLWQRTLDGDPVSAPVTIGDTIYLMLDNASIVTFDIESGNSNGVLETSPAQIGNKFALAGLATDGESLYATFGDRFLYKFGKQKN